VEGAMRIYLDVSCLNRPFDDQRQARIRMEAEAVLLILDRATLGIWTQVNSEMSTIELAAVRDETRRKRVLRLLPTGIMPLTTQIESRAREMIEGGLHSADAVHVAAAERIADVFLTCDDKLLRQCRRLGSNLRVKVMNPVPFIEEQTDVPNA